MAASRHDTPDKAGARAGLWHGLARLWDRREPDAGDGGARALERVFARLSALGQQVALEGWRVLTASMDIARESKAHADRLRESLPMMEEIRQSAAQATTLCGDARTRVLEARRMMEQCVTLSEQRTAMIAELVSSIARSHDAFAQVSSNATEVERFLEVIQEIGAQTNLLALNAAIEAARAGAHGTGFLVVAREMRLLADKTESATHEIRQITDRMQTATHSAGMVLTAALRTSSAGEEQGRRVAAAVHGTQPPMHEAEANLLRVAEAAGQQMRSLEQLEEQWRAMREGASDSTQDADASAELSMQTIGLAVGFFTDLAELAEVLGELPLLPVARGGDGQAAAWRGRAAGLVRESARCAAESGVARLEEMRPQLAAGLRELKLECTSRGLASRRGRTHSGDTLPELCVGGRAINGSFDQVDVVLRRTGLSATLFVLAEEEDDGARVFYRVSTTVKRSDGNRAVKTSLNPRGSVAEKLLAGEPTYGYAYILGLPHLAAYEPIRDAVGEVIGAWYVGLAIKDEGKPAARAAA